MKLSIITINFNNKSGLENTIKSVMSQTFRDFEYIIIDGGSTDGSKDVIESFCAKPHTNISYWCSEPDDGIYNAMNKGIIKAKGDYINFMNSGDTFASPVSLALAAKYEWNADVIMGDIFYWTKYSRWYDYIQAPDILGFQRLLKYGLFHQSSFINRSLFEDAMYNESYKIVSDWAFWFDKLLIEKRTYKHIPVPISIFEGGGISADNHEALWEERRNHLNRYFSSKMLECVLSDLEWDKEIEYKFILQNERSVLKGIIAFVDKNFNRFVLPIVKRYKNKKYINQVWINN